jgi:hypothetical protein
MLSIDGDHPMTTTDFSKKQFATILSALDDAPRNPANRGEALRAIGRSAQRFGLSTEEVLGAASGLLDGRLSPADFRVELQDLGGTDEAASGQESPTTTQGDGQASDTATEPAEPAQAVPTGDEPGAEAAADAQQTKPAKRKAKTKPATAKSTKPEKAAPAEKRTPRAGTKQAKLIELLRRHQGATVEQIAEATGWQKHTIRGAISGALKEKLGFNVEATRTREVGPNKAGAKGSSTVYRIVG